MKLANDPAAIAARPASMSIDGDIDATSMVRRSGSSFYWAMRVLPADQRQAMFAIYAFCRIVDDIADEPGESAGKWPVLAEWRAEIDRLYGGQPKTALGRHLAQAVARFDLQRDDFLAIIDGMAMDINGPMRRPSLAVLDLYCARVACAVGLLSVRVFGANLEAGRRLAQSLGRALQLTNVLRDLAEDARIGRLYLPDELLSEAGIDTREPGAVLADPRLPAVCDRLADMARRHFVAAAEAIGECPPARVRPARVMLETYRRILERLVAARWVTLERRVTLWTPMKLYIALRYGLF